MLRKLRDNVQEKVNAANPPPTTKTTNTNSTVVQGTVFQPPSATTTATKSTTVIRKKSVLIGINYTRLGKGCLNGCINDVKNIKDYISKQQGYPDDSEHMRVLIDEASTPSSLLPTRANMETAFRWLVADAQDGDYLFVHYSGHGGQVKDTDGDEEDGMDETLCPLDYPSAGQITDDELHELLVQPLPEGAHLCFVADCCHSGSILDLPYQYKSQADGTIKMNVGKHARGLAKNLAMLAVGVGVGLPIMKVRAGIGLLKGVGEAMKDARDVKKQNATSEATGLQQQSNKKGGKVILITGCKDEQTSADAFIDNSPSGALTYGLLHTLKNGGQSISYEDLLMKTREVLKGKYTQVPQLCTGEEINMNDQFIL